MARFCLPWYGHQHGHIRDPEIYGTTAYYKGVQLNSMDDLTRSSQYCDMSRLQRHVSQQVIEDKRQKPTTRNRSSQWHSCHKPSTQLDPMISTPSKSFRSRDLHVGNVKHTDTSEKLRQTLSTSCAGAERLHSHSRHEQQNPKQLSQTLHRIPGCEDLRASLRI